MKVFVAAVDEGSLAGAGRKLRRSPAAVSRAIAFLEARAGTQLLYRTTRSLKKSEAGERYKAICRRILAEREEADTIAAGERSAPRGTLSLTAPLSSGERLLRPVLDAFLDIYPAVSGRLYLFDTMVNLIDEGIDVALRIGNLPDSTSVAVRIGEVRRVITAAPSYLKNRPRIEKPSDLAKHDIITLPHFGIESWSFPPLPGFSVSRSVQFTPRLVVNNVAAAVASTVDGRGVTRLLSYQIADQVHDGQLELLLVEDEYPALPVHLVMPQGRQSVPKVRAFVDFAVPRLKKQFGKLINEAKVAPGAIQPRRGRVSSE